MKRIARLISIALAILAGSLLASSHAEAGTKIRACGLGDGKRTPKTVQLVCSASLVSDGIQMLFKASSWDWKLNRATGTGTATFNEDLLTGKTPPPCTDPKGQCYLKQVTKPARLELSRPSHCDGAGQVFSKAKVFIPGTDYESSPWTPPILFPCPKAVVPQPKAKIRRGKAIQVVKAALRDFRGSTYWHGSFDRSISCKRRTRLTMGCKARWKKSAIDNGGSITLRGTLRGKVHRLSTTGNYGVRFRVNVEPIGDNPYGHAPGPFIIQGTYGYGRA